MREDVNIRFVMFRVLVSNHPYFPEAISFSGGFIPEIS